MGMAHVCVKCGAALSRIRPVRDRHYGLPLIFCPTCGRACVRRYPLRESWWPLRRLLSTLATLTLQIILLLALTAVTIGHVRLLANDLQRGDYLPTSRVDRAMLIWMSVVFPILIGLWLTTGFGHWRRWSAWAGWGTLVALLLAVGPVLQPLSQRLEHWMGADVTPQPLGVVRWLVQLAVLAGMLVMATAGIPLGHRLRAAHARHRASRWRRRRLKWRARRVAA